MSGRATTAGALLLAAAAALPVALPAALLDAAAAQAGRVEGVVEVERGTRGALVVYLEPADPRHYEPPAASALIDQIDLRFVPQVVAVVPGTTVAFPNSDPILHNVFSPRGPGDGFNLGTYPPGETRARRFTEPGVHVILCHMHPDMVAYVAVVPTPYNGVVDAEGRFAIEAVPAGAYTLRVWRARRLAYEQEVAVTAGAATELRIRLQR
jgi:plastocyanin